MDGIELDVSNGDEIGTCVDGSQQVDKQKAVYACQTWRFSNKHSPVEINIEESIFEGHLDRGPHGGGSLGLYWDASCYYCHGRSGSDRRTLKF